MGRLCHPVPEGLANPFWLWPRGVPGCAKQAHQEGEKPRTTLLQKLKLPANTGPATMWLTEFEDHWPYQAAPADVYFSRDPNQNSQHREPIYVNARVRWPTDFTVYAIATFIALPPLVRRVRRKRRS